MKILTVAEKVQYHLKVSNQVVRLVHWLQYRHHTMELLMIEGDLIFKTNDGSDDNAPTERLRIDSGGNVKIGTTATASHGAADNHVLALSGSQNNGSGFSIY